MYVRKLTSQIATAVLVSRFSRSGNPLPCLRRQVPLLLPPAVAMSDQKAKITVDRDELKKKLTPEQYHVTQEQGTEAPWTGMCSCNCRNLFLTN